MPLLFNDFAGRGARGAGAGARQKGGDRAQSADCGQADEPGTDRFLALLLHVIRLLCILRLYLPMFNDLHVWLLNMPAGRYFNL